MYCTHDLWKVSAAFLLTHLLSLLRCFLTHDYYSPRLYDYVLILQLLSRVTLSRFYLIMLCLSNRKRPLESPYRVRSTAVLAGLVKEPADLGGWSPSHAANLLYSPPQTRTCWTAGWSNSRWTTPLRVYVTINNMIYLQNGHNESNIKCSEVIQQYTAILKCLLLNIAYCFTYYF